MNELYAVLEWDAGEIKEARVVARDQTLDTANWLIQISPSYYHREIIPMSELEEYEAI